MKTLRNLKYKQKKKLSQTKKSSQKNKQTKKYRGGADCTNDASHIWRISESLLKNATPYVFKIQACDQLNLVMDNYMTYARCVSNNIDILTIFELLQNVKNTYEDPTYQIKNVTDPLMAYANSDYYPLLESIDISKSDILRYLLTTNVNKALEQTGLIMTDESFNNIPNNDKAYINQNYKNIGIDLVSKMLNVNVIFILMSVFILTLTTINQYCDTIVVAGSVLICQEIRRLMRFTPINEESMDKSVNRTLSNDTYQTIISINVITFFLRNAVIIFLNSFAQQINSIDNNRNVNDNDKLLLKWIYKMCFSFFSDYVENTFTTKIINHNIDLLNTVDLQYFQLELPKPQDIIQPATASNQPATASNQPKPMCASDVVKIEKIKKINAKIKKLYDIFIGDHNKINNFNDFTNLPLFQNIFSLNTIFSCIFTKYKKPDSLNNFINKIAEIKNGNKLDKFTAGVNVFRSCIGTTLGSVLFSLNFFWYNGVFKSLMNE